LTTQLDSFFDFILTSSHMDMLSEYGTAATPIGHGRRISSIRMVSSEPGTATPTGRQITDAQIQQAIQGWIADGTAPAMTANTLYFIYLPPSVVSIMQGGDQSCNAFCGYHSAVGNLYYAVIPYVTCSGCVFTGDFLDTLTEVSSHELVEAITDPALNAWWDPNTGNEIGDICNRQTVRLGGYIIQTEWSNSQQACVIAPLVSTYPRMGVQFTDVILAHASRQWFTFNWSEREIVEWWILPTKPRPGSPSLTWSVSIERATDNFLTYWLTVTNLTTEDIAFEARYSVLGRI
jgi:hypothetical protein